MEKLPNVVIPRLQDLVEGEHILDGLVSIEDEIGRAHV